MWVRLEDVCEFNPLSSIEGIDIAFGSWVLDLEDIEKNTGFLLHKKIKSSDNIKSQKNTFNKDYVLYGKLRPYLNKVIISDDNGFCSTEILPIRTKDYLFNKFLQAYLMSPYFLDYARNDSYGTKMPRLNIANFKLQQFPLPPLNEQKRIVAKIEELLPFIEEYDKKEQKLTTLNQQFPEQLKKSILQAAIQGQLVAQDLNDEPASELIKRIQAEKERLISEKKIKKPKVKSEIVVRDGLPYEIINGVERCIADELPFEIPESWCWVRLGDIGDWGAGSTPNRHEPKFYDNGTIPWLKTGDLNDGYITSIPEYITNFALEKNSLKINPTGSVLIAMYGATIGKLGILGIEATTNQACCACQVYKGVYNKYLFYYLMSQKKELQKRSEGSGQPNISREKIIKYLFPLPPIDEQKRIVQKIEEVFSHIESL